MSSATVELYGYDHNASQNREDETTKIITRLVRSPTAPAMKAINFQENARKNRPVLGKLLQWPRAFGSGWLDRAGHSRIGSIVVS